MTGPTKMTPRDREELARALREVEEERRRGAAGRTVGEVVAGMREAIRQQTNKKSEA